MERVAQAAIFVLEHGVPVNFIPVQFNPTEMTLSKGVQTAEIVVPGLDTPLLQFVRGQAETLTVELFFDTTEAGTGFAVTPVTTLTDRVYQLTKIVPTTHAPPVCLFVWSPAFPGLQVDAGLAGQRRVAFQCVVESVRQRFTLFSSLGVPLRATLSVTLKEYKPLEQQVAQLNLTSPDRTHSHVVRRGETLAGIAARHYRRPGEWRRIAAANGIDDPRRLAPGAFLRVPPLP